MNGDFILLLIYILEAAILGAIAFIVRRKHSKFPDFKIGYHVKEAEADRESWEYANDIAGKICALFAMVFLAAGLFCYIMGLSFIYTFELFVNEQNPQARGFYEHMGFAVRERSELDEQGNPYPILFMERG